VHALVTAVLLRMSQLDAFDRNAEAGLALAHLELQVRGQHS
jgi:hypothetical protein